MFDEDENEEPPALYLENLLAFEIFLEARLMPLRSAFGEVMGYDQRVLDRLYRTHRVPRNREREVTEKLILLQPLLFRKPSSNDD